MTNKEYEFWKILIRIVFLACLLGGSLLLFGGVLALYKFLLFG